MSAFVVAVAILSLVPALNALLNLCLLRTPSPVPGRPSVSILVPARDEEAAIGDCVEAALRSRDVDLEVIVLDDESRDRTRAIVEAIARRDRRVRVIRGDAPAPDLKGKAAACQALAAASARPFLLFVDADVRLAPDAAVRLVPRDGIDLLSGVPRQRLDGLVATAVVPMITTLLLDYLPLLAARYLPRQPALAAACGQLMMVRASAYHACGGHGAVGSRMHEALHLARHFRRNGHATDLVDATPLAECRMYATAAEVFAGFGKNATEGMARPLALPIWTCLLVGGHLLPFVTVPLAIAAGSLPLALGAVLCAATLVAARAWQTIRGREPWLAFLLHPLGVCLTLVIQYRAFVAWLRGGRVEWKGRSYVPQL